MTGIANMAADVTSKRIALLKEAVPSVRLVALFAHPEEPIVAPQVQDVKRSAAVLGIEHRTFLMRTSEDLQRALDLAVAWRADAVVRLAGQGFTLGADTGQLATERALPSMLLQKQDVEACGLCPILPITASFGGGLLLTLIAFLRGCTKRPSV